MGEGLVRQQARVQELLRKWVGDAVVTKAMFMLVISALALDELQGDAEALFEELAKGDGFTAESFPTKL